MRRDADPNGMPARDMELYEQLISDGIAAAARRRSAIDHVTARRTAIWLMSRPQQPDFIRGLLEFAKTGAITQNLKTQLRNYARRYGDPSQPHASRLLQYAAARGHDLGPIAPDFAGLCDRVDQADHMLAGLRQRIRDGRGLPEPEWPDTDGPRLIAMARHDPASQTVSIILDATTANIAMYAITNHALDREAHTREVRQYSEKLPENSHSRRARQDIAARETRIAERLRAIECAYRIALDHDATPTMEPLEIARPSGRPSDPEPELE
jgi:hypothetical protein